MPVKAPPLDYTSVVQNHQSSQAHFDRCYRNQLPPIHRCKRSARNLQHSEVRTDLREHNNRYDEEKLTKLLNHLADSWRSWEKYLIGGFVLCSICLFQIIDSGWLGLGFLEPDMCADSNPPFDLSITSLIFLWCPTWTQVHSFKSATIFIRGQVMI